MSDCPHKWQDCGAGIKWCPICKRITPDTFGSAPEPAMPRSLVWLFRILAAIVVAAVAYKVLVE